MSFSLDKGENIIFEGRRSWFFLWSKISAWVFSLIIPIAIFSIFSAIESFNFGPKENYLFIIFLLAWLFIVWSFIFIALTDHFLDVLIITNKHIIDIEQKGLFSREISVISLSEIQDITTTIDGFTETVLGYGTLIIQSAGSSREFVIKYLHNPTQIRSKIKQAISGEVSVENN